MTALLTHAELWLTHLTRATLHAGALAVVVGALILMLGRRLPAGVRYALWALVLLRLAIPVLPAVRWSPMTLLPQASQAQSRETNLPQPSASLKWEVRLGAIELPRANASAAAEPVRPRTSRWPMVLTCVWASVAAGLMLAAIFSYGRLLRRICRGQRVDDPAILQLITDCAREMAVHAPAIVESALVDGPALVGIFRPTIVMPLGLSRQLSPRQWRHVILHELAHLKRRDLWIDWGIVVLVCLHWFNPLAWLAAWRFRTEREILRDAMVLDHSREQEREAYGRTLVDLIETLARPAARMGAVGMLAERADLRRRLTMILSGNRRSFLRTVLGGVLLIGLSLTAFTRAEDARPAPVTRPGAATPGTPARAEDPKTRLLEEQLEGRRLQEVRFDGIALADVIDFLRDVSGANITVDWKTIEAAGIKKTAPVSVRMRNIKFGRALSTILADVGNGEVKLAYTIDDGVILISTAAEIADKDRRICVYDVRDLLVDLSKPVAVGAGEAAIENDTKPIKYNERQVQDITNLIKETVDRESWDDNGGKVGQLKFLSGQFIVTQTRENHAQIAALLNKLRESRSIQVSVEMRIMQVRRAVLLDAGIDADALLGQAGGAKADGKVKAPTTRPGPILDELQLKVLLGAVQRDKGSTVLTAPRITVFNGQSGMVRVGKEQAYVSGFRPGGSGEGKWVHITATVQDGIDVDVQPTVSADRKFVTLQLHPRVTEIRAMRDVVWDKAPAGEKLLIQKPDLAVQEVNSIVSIPDGGTLVLALSKAEGKNAEADVVTLFTARPTIVIQREAEQQEFPAIKPPLSDRPVKP